MGAATASERGLAAASAWSARACEPPAQYCERISACGVTGVLHGGEVGWRDGGICQISACGVTGGSHSWQIGRRSRCRGRLSDRGVTGWLHGGQIPRSDCLAGWVICLQCDRWIAQLADRPAGQENLSGICLRCDCSSTSQADTKAASTRRPAACRPYCLRRCAATAPSTPRAATPIAPATFGRRS